MHMRQLNPPEWRPLLSSCSLLKVDPCFLRGNRHPWPPRCWASAATSPSKRRSQALPRPQLGTLQSLALTRPVAGGISLSNLCHHASAQVAPIKHQNPCFARWRGVQQESSITSTFASASVCVYDSPHPQPAPVPTVGPSTKRIHREIIVTNICYSIRISTTVLDLVSQGCKCNLSQPPPLELMRRPQAYAAPFGWGRCKEAQGRGCNSHHQREV